MAIIAITNSCAKKNMLVIGHPNASTTYTIDTSLILLDTVPYVDAGSNPEYAPSFIEGYKNDAIRDKKTAVYIAEAIWFSLYGKNEILKQRPYQVYLKDSIWVVYGSDNHGPNTKGGTAYIEINKHDGRIIRLFHGE